MHSTILQYLENVEAKYPQKIAFADSKEEYSFYDLLVNARKVGSYISSKVEPRNPVVIYMDKRAYNICAFMGAVYAGCFYVPIDSQMPIERISLILQTLKPKLILYDDVTEKSIGQFNDEYETVSYKEAVETEISEDILHQIRVNTKNTDLLYVLFTSGSTGTPKGVTISHMAVMDFMEWICEKYQLTEETSLCNQAPFYFDASVPDLYIPLMVGATTYIPPKSYYTFPKKILQFIDENKINTLVWVPSALCNVVNCKAFEVTVPTTVRLVIFCGEVMPCKHLNVWKKYIPKAHYVNMYGPTEATYACMYYDIDKEFSNDDKLPLGRACENSTILLITDDNHIAAPGEIGEICILGQCLSSGYYNAPETTKAAFVQNPVNTKYNEMMYRTGDLASYDTDDNMVFAGRKDFQIKRLGHRIELGEIENAVLSVANIENACAIFNPKTNDIIAVYAGGIEIEELGKILSEKLPHYMLPTRYEKLAALPMNLNGKIDRVKLKSLYGEN